LSPLIGDGQGLDEPTTNLMTADAFLLGEQESTERADVSLAAAHLRYEDAADGMSARVGTVALAVRAAGTLTR
jgi:hypothetical protein